jgi:hypothetical protein
MSTFGTRVSQSPSSFQAPGNIQYRPSSEAEVGKIAPPPLTLTLSRGEREQQPNANYFSQVNPPVSGSGGQCSTGVSIALWPATAATTLTAGTQIDTHSFPLSPGERAGVRVGTLTQSPASNFKFHLSRT